MRRAVAALAFASLAAFGQVRPHEPEHPSGWVDKAPVHAHNPWKDNARREALRG